jgi:hypothetical protein
MIQKEKVEQGIKMGKGQISNLSDYKQQMNTCKGSTSAIIKEM